MIFAEAAALVRSLVDEPLDGVVVGVPWQRWESS